MPDGARPHISEVSENVADLPKRGSGYASTRARVEDYFDRTATQTWERLTSTEKVSRIRETVRKGRDEMRATMLSRLPENLRGARVLDAGCGTGAMTEELAKRGADVAAVDISPSLIGIAKTRLPRNLHRQVSFTAGDMLNAGHGAFDFVVAMDSLIYYNATDIAAALEGLERRTSGSIVFTVAPRTPMLMIMFRAGKLFPRNDRSPTMIPHDLNGLTKACKAGGVSRILRPVSRVSSGFYISQAMELIP